MRTQSEGRVGIYGLDLDDPRYVVVRELQDGELADVIQEVLEPFIGQVVTVTVEVKTPVTQSP